MVFLRLAENLTFCSPWFEDCFLESWKRSPGGFCFLSFEVLSSRGTQCLGTPWDNQHTEDLSLKANWFRVWFCVSCGVRLYFYVLFLALLLFYFVAKKTLLNLWVASLYPTHRSRFFSPRLGTPQLIHLQCQEQPQSTSKASILPALALPRNWVPVLCWPKSAAGSSVCDCVLWKWARGVRNGLESQSCEETIL